MSTIFKRPKLPNFDLMTKEEIRQYTDQFEGVFFAVPLDGQYCFGRVLRRTITACYDLPPSGIRPIDEIEQAPVLFRATGAISAVLGGRRWKILGKKPLHGALAEPSKFYRETYLHGFIEVYDDGTYRPYSGDDLSRMDRLGIETPWHFERRIRWHIAGDPNAHKGVRFDPSDGRLYRLKARAMLAAGELLPEKVVRFLQSTSEEQLDAFAPK